MADCPYARGHHDLEIIRSGYLAMATLRRKAGLPSGSTSPFRFKALGEKTTLVRGTDGMSAFYDSQRISRSGAMPPFVQRPLFGDGAVHTLDDSQHHVRKQQMADVAYIETHVDRFAGILESELNEMLDRWRSGGEDEATVHAGTAVTYGRAAFRCAGIELAAEEADRRSLQMTQLLYGFGRFGPGHVRARINKIRLDRWAKMLIEQVRSGEVHPEGGTALAEMAALRDEKGQLVDAHTAGVELQSLTRPTVAVARFAAIALVEHPDWAARIRKAVERDDGHFPRPREAVAFAQVVRRTYPFVPALPGLARKKSSFDGCPVERGERVVLDILGTNTDPNEWDRPAEFDPARFYDRDDLATLEDHEKIAAFIPQGGGHVRTGHRCPGEKIAVTALTGAVSALCRPGVQISSEPEDLVFDWHKVLTRPRTGVRVRVAKRAAGPTTLTRG